MRLATDRMDSSNRGEHPLVRVIGASGTDREESIVGLREMMLSISQ